MAGKLFTLPVPARRAAAGRLRRARLALGWSQERAARELGIGVRTLRDLELGRARMTALEALCVLEQEGEAQVVVRRFPKPQVAGSTPAALASVRRAA